jgi:hypothetical protein
VISLSIGGRLVRRLGPGATAALGCLLFAIGAVIWVWRVGAAPDYTGGLLPGQLFTGAGVGLVMPSLSGVVGLVLPPAKWGAGSSMINTARQIGTVLGTAILVALYGATPDLDAFRRGWLFLAAAALAAALTGGAIAARRNSADIYQPPESWVTGRIRQHDGTPVGGAALAGNPGTELTLTVTPTPARLSGVARDHAGVPVADATEPSCRVTGIVHNGHGPVAGARVTLLDPYGNAVGTRETTDNGYYEFVDLPAGQYRLIATGFPPSTTTTRLLERGETGSHDIVLRHP